LGCFKPGFVTITEPAVKFTASITGQTNIPCAGSNNGSATALGSGGVSPYQYNIDGGSFQPGGTFSNLAPGAHTIIARDANNCEVTLPFTITAPAQPLTATISAQTNVLCSGQSNGNATVTAAGGTAPYTYLWNTVPAQSGATATALKAGNYTVTVTDNAGCIKTATVTIIQPTAIVVTVTKTDVKCRGELTGTATASASGGKPPYTYAWFTTPIQAAATAINLGAGTYSVAVFDSLGCFKPGFVTITEPATKFTASISGQTNVACASSNTGVVTIAGNGGIAPYQYNINGGAFQPGGTFSGLTAGSYTVIAKDANGCEVILPVVITAPLNGIAAVISSVTHVTCTGQSDGSAIVTASGGTAPYTYLWNTIPAQSTATISNLTAGNYIVTTTDAAGCFVIDTAVVTEPLPLKTAIVSQVNYNCATGTNGSVTVAGSDGTPGYQYSLDGDPYQPGGTFSNLPAGNYVVTVKDANNCTIDKAVQIAVDGLILAVDDGLTTTEDTPLNDNVMVNDQVLCNLPIVVTSNTDPQHGTVSVSADGSFTYSPAPDFNGTDSFTYTITDNTGASSIATVTIQVDPVNDPPVIVSESIVVLYNTPASGTLSFTGNYDPDGTALTISTIPVVDPLHGIFSIAADGSYTYTPDLNYQGSDMAVISICDAGLPLPPACSNDTLYITVLPPNQPPVVVSEKVTVCIDAPFVGTITNGGTVFNGDSDPENNLPLTVNSVPLQGPSHGVFSFTDVVAGTFDYTPDNGYAGMDFVVLSLCDSGTPVECSNDTVYFEIVAPVPANAGLSQELCNADVATLVGNAAAPGTGSWALVSGPAVPVISPSTGNVALATGLVASPVSYVFSYTTTYKGCSSTDTMQVLVNLPATAAYAGIDQKLCSNSLLTGTTLAANTAVSGTGTWSQLSGPAPAVFADVNDPSSDISDLVPGDYAFQWQITNGICQPSADVVTVSVSAPPVANAGADIETCELAPVSITGSSASGAASVLWTSSGNGTFDDSTSLNPVYTPGTVDISAGAVLLTLRADGNGTCPPATDILVLTVHKTPLADAGPDVSICTGKNFTIGNATASSYSTLQWTVVPATAGTVAAATSLMPTFNPAAGFSGTASLVLTVKGMGACMTNEITDTMNIEVITSLVADAGMDLTILPGAITGLTGNVSGGSGFYAWSWIPADKLENAGIQNPVTIELFADTKFALTVLDITTGCTSTDTVQVIIDKENYPLAAVADYDTTLIDMPVTIAVLANDRKPDGDEFVLSLCGSPSHGIVVLNSDSTITYTPYPGFEGEDSFCYRICDNNKPLLCADTLVYIHVKKASIDDLHAYSGISPNKDGSNDVWKVRGIEKYPDNTVMILNRWGDKIREYAGYNNTTRSWDGKNEHGENVPDGTYFYIVDVKNVGVLKGWIFVRGK